MRNMLLSVICKLSGWMTVFRWELYKIGILFVTMKQRGFFGGEDINASYCTSENLRWNSVI